jgi:protein required for attachment to host cells
MSKPKIDQGDWIVVCHGAKALVLENIGDGKFPNLKTREVYEQPDPKTSEQGTDAPGRSINSVDAMRSAVEQTDWHDETERSFLTKLAEALGRMTQPCRKRR